MAKHTAPANLGAKARKMWRGITEVYDLRPDELRLLEEACREVDLIELMETALGDDLATGKVTVKGSMGQEVAHPLMSEIRQHRGALQRLLAALKLPDEAKDEADKATRSAAARTASHARWKRGA